MPEQPKTDSRQATAERNREAIMDATVRLLEAGRRPSVSAVAEEAGVSRVTVYSHFAEHEELLGAVVERAVVRAINAINAADPDRGSASDALERVISASWQEIAGNAAIADAASAELGHETMRKSHQQAFAVVRGLIERGREDGSFRRDLETDWLVSCFFSLIHMARAEVQAGRLKADRALAVVEVTVGGLLAA
jgi:AcrR family transcriptional regulator